MEKIGLELTFASIWGERRRSDGRLLFFCGLERDEAVRRLDAHTQPDGGRDLSMTADGSHMLDETARWCLSSVFADGGIDPSRGRSFCATCQASQSWHPRLPYLLASEPPTRQRLFIHAAIWFPSRLPRHSLLLCPRPLS